MATMTGTTSGRQLVDVSCIKPRPRRTIPNYPLRNRYDETRLIRRRQYASAFLRVSGAEAQYPDPAWSYVRATPYGMTHTELRAEWARRLSEGWARWELDARLLPGPLAAWPSR